MDYIYENLGDERFEEFCASLISNEFPNIQVYPIGQPDGGRDSVVYKMNSNKKEFIVFQVKYVRNPNQERDVHKWLLETIKGEVEKIDKLIPKGAISYYLLTNVRGTAHLDTGSKDKVNKILEENISIPSICWWRDDLSTLFEKNPIFKWSFLEILNGQDILNSVLFNNLQENKERRENVIRAYLTDQFEMDKEVKFKQIDLQNRLLNLYTDVPIGIRKFNPKNKSLKQTLDLLNPQKNDLVYEESDLMRNKSDMGAAEFLLHPKVQSEIKNVLLEGGPGQGKSTISQYICQVHRVKLLNKKDDINLLPENTKNTPTRLPIKIDLRDIASWVERKNPYQGVLTQEYFDNIWKNSLESFLVAHIFYHSKLEEFTSTDLISICKLSPTLFVFDGFDEIANIKVRGEVIEFINKGITRISSNSKTIQIIITSRPAAFSDSVGFSSDHYPHFQLTDITPSVINKYVEKWIKSSNLSVRDANELRKLIEDKLELPHLKDLTKSPMQLAIFISLLRTKGQSLPNKRTALYDSYIELLFDRESEKHTLIRDRRDLIIDIHQYLAWILHSEAEMLKNNGRVTIENLNVRLKKYLALEGHDTTIADQLFVVMRERVCALVSRVQGTFEFEVQPLREYFCAKHLYRSAPHSSAGSVKQGTKPDRLHAILRNFYWQNVVRFFAGCADAGELDMIIQELKDLQNDELLKYTNYPRIVTSQILSDYVFTQKPLKLKSVVEIITNGINIGNVINQNNNYHSSDPLVLPNECGRVELLQECFQELIKLPNTDFANELIGIINNNPLNNLNAWMEHSSLFSGSKLTTWLEYGYKLKLIYRIQEDYLIGLLEESENSELTKRLQYIINGNRFDIINNNQHLRQFVLNAVLKNELSVFERSDFNSSLNFLTITLHPYILSRLLSSNLGSGTFLSNVSRLLPQLTFLDFDLIDEIDNKINEFKNSIFEIFQTPISKFQNEIEPWNIIVEAGRMHFTDTWTFKIISVIAAGIKSRNESYDEYTELYDDSISLCKRVRCARLKSGNGRFWKKQLEDSPDIKFTLLIFLTWATPKTIMKLIPTLSEIIEKMKDDDFSTLRMSLSNTVENSLFTKTQSKYILDHISKIKDYNKVKHIISIRFDAYVRQSFVYKNVKNNDSLISIVHTKLEHLTNLFYLDPSSFETLEKLKSTYKSIGQNRKYFRPRNLKAKIPYDIAKKIMLDCKNYPRSIVALAEKTCRLIANKNIVPIGEIAIKENWFDEI